MTQNYERAGLFVMISGLLHLPIFLYTGFAGAGVAMLIIGILWIVIGQTLRNKNPRWLAWLTYLLMLGGILVALIGMGSGTLPFIWALGIFLADVLAAFFLFKVLWADKIIA